MQLSPLPDMGHRPPLETGVGCESNVQAIDGIETTTRGGGSVDLLGDFMS
jgi:hypothetical protein